MSKFDQRINEMLVVLNAVKKKKKEDKDDAKPVDSVTGAMNDALGRFGMSVSDDVPDSEPEDDEDPIEGSIEDIEDLDLPRPADDADDEPASDDDEGDENGVGAPIDGEEDHSQDFDFLNVGGPSDIKSTETKNFKDDDSSAIGGMESGKVEFRYDKDSGAIVIKSDSGEITISDEEIGALKNFIDSISEGHDDSESEKGSDDFEFGNDDNQDDDNQDDKDSEED